MSSSAATNAPLIAALQAWLEECEAALFQSFADFVHVVSLPSWHAQVDGSFHHYPYTPDYKYDVLEQRFFSSNERWSVVEQLARDDERFSQHIETMIYLSDGSGRRFDLIEICSTLLPRLSLRGDQIVSRASEPASARVKALLDFIGAEDAEVQVIWPIRRAFADAPIDLDDHTQFRELTTDEKLHCLNSGIIGPHRINNVPADRARWFALCRRTSSKKRFGERFPNHAEFEQQEAENESVLDDFLAIVPLVTDRAALHAGGSYGTPRIQLAGTLADVTGRGGTPILEFLVVREGEVISETAAQQIKELWGFMRRAKTGFRAQVANAARRCFYAETRFKPEDMLVDLMIAAEYLYGNTEEKNELSYRYSLRAAHWHDGDQTSKKDVFKTFRDAYTCRSKIVHGSSVSTEEVRDAANKVRPLLRAAIRQAVAHADEHNARPDWEGMLFPSSSE